MAKSGKKELEKALMEPLESASHEDSETPKKERKEHKKSRHARPGSAASSHRKPMNRGTSMKSDESLVSLRVC